MALTAYDMHKVLRILEKLKEGNMEQFSNPEFVGELQAGAHTMAILLKHELKNLDVEIA